MVFLALKKRETFFNIRLHTQEVIRGQGKTIIDCPGKKVEAQKKASRRLSIQAIELPKNRFGGLTKKPSGGKFTFTMRCADMVVSVGLSLHLSMGTTMQQRLYFNTTAATGTGVENVTRKIVTKSLTAMTKHAKTGSKPQ